MSEGGRIGLPEVGARFETESIGVTRETIHAFAERFDPQAMHLDDAAAGASVFGELVASGWQTACLTMRMVVRADILNGAPLVGLEVKRLKFEGPVRPGDVLRAEAVIESARGATRADRGIAAVGVTTFARGPDGDERVVLTQTWTVLVTPA
ncbi:MAG: MaoC/PaaZ C-terminal domain-containing protein [Phycisphaerales bacterium]